MWLLKTKIWRKSKIILLGYIEIYGPHSTVDVYIDIAKDVETRFHTSKLGGKLIIECVTLTPKQVAI